MLFLRNKNGGRSQTAADWARSLGGDAVVVTVPNEFGSDTAGEFPKSVTEEMIQRATVVVSLKADLELRPRVVGPRYEVWERAAGGRPACQARQGR